MSRTKNIKLHKEYGLNPTICTCFYCGEDTEEIALLGAAYKSKAPSHMCTSLEPCDKCKEKYKDHVLVVEVESEQNPIPTGRYFAVKKEIVGIENANVMLCKSIDFQQCINDKKGGE